jgi:hypothetical protein
MLNTYKKNNMKKDLKDKKCRCGRESNGSEYGSVGVFCENGNGLRGAYKGAIFV